MSQHQRPGRIPEINFRNRFRIPSTRLRGWDYASEGYYFVTICVKDRLTSLAKIIDGDVLLSPIGEIIAEEWKKNRGDSEEGEIGRMGDYSGPCARNHCNCPFR